MKKKSANSLWIIFLPLLVFCVLGTFIAIERAGIILHRGLPADSAYLPPDIIIPRIEHKPDTQCLLICNSDEDYTYSAFQNITFVLDQMSVGYTVLDVSQNAKLPDLKQYKTVMIACSEFSPIVLSLEAIFDWVKAGGGLLFAHTPEEQWLYLFHSRDIGLEKPTFSIVPQITATLETDFLAGGKGAKVQWSIGSEEGYRYGGNYTLDKSCTVHMTSAGPDGATPMLWERRLGRGRVVVNNNDAMGEPESRGLIAAAYSLTQAATAYPVINASMFFIDDFPAPIPEGYSPYLRRDFGVTTEYFFVYIWFPQMMRLANKHQIKYTSVFIPTYNDITSPPFPGVTPDINERLKYFGALFMNEGHEMGLHGYNHQSIVFQDYDYRGLLDYNKWEKEEDILTALNQTVDLQKQLFRGVEMRTYVPPSNVLSKEGRAILKKNFPEINVISDLLINDEFDISSNFGINEDGLIDIPRITSGYFPFADDTDEMALWLFLNELNLHFVNSHFIHPDDVLDPDRGAEKGWNSLFASFDEYLTWLSQFPLRNMTAQEAAGAVQRFDCLTVHTDLFRDSIEITLDGFYDEAWLLVRINDGAPSQVSGGVLTELSSSLYLLKAEKSRVTIDLEQPEP
ncbi:MAG: DUF2194 domain-containing protein [Treponema sp.]|nr:DUF2194 domain-containing protein [Treponema sp.]